MINAARNVDRGKDLVEVLLDYCDAAILTERVIRAAITNRKQASEVIELFKNHANANTPAANHSEASPLIEKAKTLEKVEIQANTDFWATRITRRIFQAAMRNWTESGNNVLIQLLKNDLKGILTQDMFLEIIRQHKPNVVKELFANQSSFFPIKQDTAEDMLAAAAANWIAGVRVFRFVIDEAKGLAAKIIPRSERIAEAVTGNWKSGKAVLDLLLRRFPFRITERVLLAAARNPYSGADIMKVLLRIYTGPISVDVLRAAAENFDDGVPLLKLLLKRGQYTRIPDEVLSAIAGNGSCGPEMLDFLVDGNYEFYLTESTLLAAVRNTSATRIFMVSPVSPGRDVQMTRELLLQQRDKRKNGNKLLKPPLQYGGIVCLMNMYASRWQECNVLWGLKDGISDDETWVRRENDWVWGTGRGMLLELLENHWVEGDLVSDSVLDVATKNFDAELIRALLKKRDKPITERQLLNATSNELYAHEVVSTLLAEKKLLPPDSVTTLVLESAARNSECGRQLLEILWTEKSEVTEDLLDVAVDNESQGEQLIAFLLEKGAKVTTALFETSVDNENQGSMIKLLLEKCDDKMLALTAKSMRRAAENRSIGSELVKDFLQIYPTMEIPDDVLFAAARNPGCGAKIMKLLLERKSISEVKEVDNLLFDAAKNPEQAIRLLSMLLKEDQVISTQVWKGAVENEEIAFEVVSFLVDRKIPSPISEDVWNAAILEPDIAVDLLRLLHKQHSDLEISEVLFRTAIYNWKSGFEVLQWMQGLPNAEHDISVALELAASNVGCGIEILNYLLSAHNPLKISSVVWRNAAGNLGCGDVMITRLLEYTNCQVELTDTTLLQAAAGNLNWSEQIFKALSNIPALSDSPTRLPEGVVSIFINNWKSGEATIRFLKNSPKWTLAVTDVLLQMIAQDTPDDAGALAVLLEGVDEFEFPEMPDAVSPFWLVRSLKAIELLVTKCKRSSLPQELVKKIVGGWRADTIARVLEGIEITQEVFLNSATNPLNSGQITKMLQEENPELVVTDEMLQKAVANNIEITKTILDMGQRVSKKALEAAVKGDNTSILELLLGTDREMKISDSVLEAAISNGSPKILRVLLRHGLENPISEHALCKAAEKEDSLEIMKLLLAHVKGKDSAKADIPQAVLDEAIVNSTVSMVQLLLDNNVMIPFCSRPRSHGVGFLDLLGLLPGFLLHLTASGAIQERTWSNSCSKPTKTA
ncbi:hypothetical protein L207DRAFT_319355 [Hyaloscypha variabilis F]|uniref:Ankyrin n=1 Tax=Hyaloscypha variabilis (strain UAMH 11265 / GT02V1 / F) TaxID=1149755 RepID=A0A2J6RW62_HYAVF|nr:hypothetical protein L207DRAFT_319355 [Hyaloscypha variabilis F]